MEYAKPSAMVSGVEAAIQFKKNNLTVGMLYKGDIMTMGLANVYNKGVVVGAEVISDLAKGTTKIGVGAQCKQANGTYNVRYTSNGETNVGASFPVADNIAVKMGAQFDNNFQCSKQGMAVDFTF
mmetsp:Transcript_13358/g.20150  ORF Transcript_13358/g.20150 Transcript_13358/m.20150 type:complete len:125 (+) Transcript_13358:3443-3817(+)